MPFLSPCTLGLGVRWAWAPVPLPLLLVTTPSCTPLWHLSCKTNATQVSPLSSEQHSPQPWGPGPGQCLHEVWDWPVCKGGDGTGLHCWVSV